MIIDLSGELVPGGLTRGMGNVVIKNMSIRCDAYSLNDTGPKS